MPTKIGPYVMILKCDTSVQLHPESMFNYCLTIKVFFQHVQYKFLHIEMMKLCM